MVSSTPLQFPDHDSVMSSNTHPNQQVLWRVAVGEATDDEVNAIASHLESCGACAVVFDELSLGKDSGVARLRMMNRSGGQAEGVRVAGFPDNEQLSEPEMDLVLGPSVVPDAIATSLAQSPPESTIGNVPMRGIGPPTANRFGDYELVEEIARGGMGVVHKARQPKLHRLVALKLILSGEFSDDDQVQRFHAEAEAAAKLDHPGIVPVYEAGQVGGRHFYSMAYVSGKSLNERVTANGPLDPKQSARLMKSVSDAVQYAHDNGIIHRDIKPGNILLDEQQQPRVTDFGLAKRVEVASELTATGQIMGTPSYMSPEQAAAKTSEIGAAADVYSLGATLYYLLVGRPPFQSPSPVETIRQVIDNEPVSLRRLDPSIPRDLETVCLKCLRKEVDKRYPTAGALADDLQRWLDGKPIEARRVGQSEKVWLWCKRRPAIASLSAALLFGTIGGFALVNERQNATHAEGLVNALVRADVDQLPGLIVDIRRLRHRTEPLLVAMRDISPNSADDRRAQLHARLVLVADDEQQVPILLEELLTNDDSYVGLIRDQLRPYLDNVKPQLWELLHDSRSEPIRRFRAGLALASYATRADPWLPSDVTFLAEQLVAANAGRQRRLREYLQPIQDHLLADLESIFANHELSELHLSGAANALADYAAKDTLRLTRLLTLATPEQYAVIYPLVAEAKSAAAAESLAQVVRETPAKNLSQADRVSLGQRRASAAITLLRQGQREQIFDVLRVGSDPESLSQFVHRCHSWGVKAGELLECVDRVDSLRKPLTGSDRKTQDRVLYGLLLALGDFQFDEISSASRQPLVDRLVRWHGQDPNSGIHGATGWLLRHWGFEKESSRVDQTPVPFDPTGQRDWYTLEIKVPKSDGQVFSLYFTFVVVSPGEYLLGTPDQNADWTERPRRVRLTRPVGITDREITWAQLDPRGRSILRTVAEFELDAGHDDYPATGISWPGAVEYGRILTRCVGLDESSQCCDVVEPLQRDEEGKPQFGGIHLDRNGFRLVTSAEWEVACRGSSQTAFSFGSNADDLSFYGWSKETADKRPHRVGQLRPNERGFFDMHGNVKEWCHDWAEFDPEEDDLSTVKEDPTGPTRGFNRTLRGGSWNDTSDECRTAIRRTGNRPGGSFHNVGFRVAQVPIVEENRAKSP